MHDWGVCAGRRVSLLSVTLLTCHWPSQLCLLVLICVKLRILVKSNGTSGPRFNQISSLRCIPACLSRQHLNPDTRTFAPRTAAAGVWGCVSVKTKEMKGDIGWLYRPHGPKSFLPVISLPGKPPPCPWASICSDRRVLSGGTVKEGSCGVQRLPAEGPLILRVQTAPWWLSGPHRPLGGFFHQLLGLALCLLEHLSVIYGSHVSDNSNITST